MGKTDIKQQPPQHSRSSHSNGGITAIFSRELFFFFKHKVNNNNSSKTWGDVEWEKESEKIIKNEIESNTVFAIIANEYSLFA